MTVLTLRTAIEPFGPAGALVLSDADVELLGGGRRAAVVVKVGERSARLRLAVMGGQNVIGLSRANRTLLAVEIGQEVEAEVSLDESPRTVTVPDDLLAALAAEPALLARFEALPYTHRREFVEWVEQAKRSQTRQRRVTGTMERLREREPSPG